jgi:hypothetical protein
VAAQVGDERVLRARVLELEPAPIERAQQARRRRVLATWRDGGLG